MSLTETGKGGEVSTGYDPFTEYSKQAGGVTSDLMKYRQGDWTFGMNDTPLEYGELFAVDMSLASAGWLKWLGGRIVDREMPATMSGILPKKRKELDMQDENDSDDPWEIDDQDENDPPRRKDPWQQTVEIPMLRLETGQDMIFSSSSKGGRDAYALLCRKYGPLYRMKEHQGCWPVVKIGSGSYNHPTRKRIVKYPTLELVGWVDEDALHSQFPVEIEQKGKAKRPTRAPKQVESKGTVF